MKLILAFLFSISVYAGTGAIPSGDNIKLLKDNLRFKNTDTKIMTNDSDDPSATAKDAEIGSLYIRGGTGVIYRKTDSGSSTNWTELAAFPVDLTTDVTGILPAANGGTGLDSSSAANGQLLIGNGSGLSLSTITGTANQVNITNGAGSITMATPQDIHTGASPTFANATITTNATVGGVDVVTLSAAQALTNKTIDADSNTITNIENADIKAAAAIDATKIADGTVTSTEFQFINSVTSDVQAQLDAKIGDYSSTNDNRLLRSDGTSGDAIQESVVSLSDVGELTNLTEVQVDNLSIDNNAISGNGANDSIALSPTGTGIVQLNSNVTTTGYPVFNIGADSTSGSNVTLVAPATKTIRLTAAGTLVSVDGIPAGLDGQEVVLVNTTGASVTVNNETGGTAANRILTGTGANISLADNATIPLVYDLSNSRWMAASVNPQTVDLTSDVSGILPNANGGTGVSMAAYSQGSILFLDASQNADESANLNWIDGSSTLNMTGIFNLDNLRLDGNSIQSTNTNGDVEIAPNGTGTVRLDKDLQMVERTAPANPIATYHKLYFKSDSNLYMKNSSGAEKEVRTVVTPTVTQYTSGSGTHTVAAGTKWIKVRVIGGGGGGSGCGTASSGNGGTGVNSTFGGLTANGGGGGVVGGFAVGGGASGGDTNLSGRSGQGESGAQNVYGKNGANSVLGLGGNGGTNGFGAGGAGQFGGGGGSAGTSSTGQGAGSGASGGYVEHIYTSPAASYSYAVGGGGAAGGAGTGGNAGGTGGGGLIIVEEH